jgi:hypothetical protein
MRKNTTREGIESLMRELGSRVLSDGCVYFTGGVSAVLLGWREMTMDVDLKADPEPQGFFEALPKLKESLDINIELASPDMFVPVLSGWRERSPFIASYGKLEFRHYDFYSQALAKVERGHTRDRNDVGSMLESGLVLPGKLLALFTEAEPRLIRYPSIEPELLRQKVFALAEGRWRP